MISVMPTKLPWYVTPCYVFLALAAGWYLARLWDREEASSRALAAALMFCALAAAVALVYQARAGRTPPPVGAVMLAIAACAGAAMLAARHSRHAGPVLAGGLYLALLSFVATPLWNWEVNEAFDVRPVAALVAAHVPAGSEVRITFPYERPSLNFYAGRRIAPVAAAEAPPRAYIVFDEATARLPEGGRTLGRAGNFALVAPTAAEPRIGGHDAAPSRGGRRGLVAR
jgi:4-amino-4-deoxy-L-arabinose transferase-like glycosyltransferase